MEYNPPPISSRRSSKGSGCFFFILGLLTGLLLGLIVIAAITYRGYQMAQSAIEEVSATTVEDNSSSDATPDTNRVSSISGLKLYEAPKETFDFKIIEISMVDRFGGAIAFVSIQDSRYLNHRNTQYYLPPINGTDYYEGQVLSLSGNRSFKLIGVYKTGATTLPVLGY